MRKKKIVEMLNNLKVVSSEEELQDVLKDKVTYVIVKGKLKLKEKIYVETETGIVECVYRKKVNLKTEEIISLEKGTFFLYNREVYLTNKELVSIYGENVVGEGEVTYIPYDSEMEVYMLYLSESDEFDICGKEKIGVCERLKETVIFENTMRDLGECIDYVILVFIFLVMVTSWLRLIG